MAKREWCRVMAEFLFKVRDAWTYTLRDLSFFQKNIKDLEIKNNSLYNKISDKPEGDG